MRPESGFTLIELVVTIVIIAIIVTAVAFFVTPLRQSTDVAMRAELTDIADNALQVLGGHGYIRDHLVELFLRNARGFAAFDGLAIV